MAKQLERAEIKIRPGSGRPGAASLTEGIANDLIAALEGKAAVVGMPVPSERKLMEIYGVSRVTTRKALSRLVADGWLERRHGIGYRVTPRETRARAAYTVGLVYRDLTATAHSSSVAVLEARLARDERSLMVTVSEGRGEGEDRCIVRLRKAGVRALIISPAVRGGPSRELSRWIRDGWPVVLEGHPGAWRLPASLAERCPQLDMDNRGGVRQLLDHLAGQGHRRYAFLTDGKCEHSERYAAFREWVEASGAIAEVSEMIEDYRAPDDMARLGEVFGDPARQPTAVVCSGDDTAWDVIEALGRLGLRCPDDVSVCGFGDETFYRAGGAFGLTTVGYSQADEADLAIAMLDAQMAGRAIEPTARRIPMQLIVRASSGVAPAQDKRRTRAIG
jgi:DNA-binding LacI/PurR family transcriptional regulator